MVFECLFPDVYTTPYGQIARAVVVGMLCFVAYLLWTRSAERSAADTDTQEANVGVEAAADPPLEWWRLWRHRISVFGSTFVYIVTSLAVLYIYYEPITNNLNWKAAGLSLMAIAAVLMSIATLVGLSCGFDPNSPTRCFFYGAMGWLVGYTWWYAFYELLNHWLSSSHNVAYRVVRAVIVVVVVAAIAALVSSLLLNALVWFGGDPVKQVVEDPRRNPSAALRMIPRLEGLERNGRRNRKWGDEAGSKSEQVPLMMPRG